MNPVLQRILLSNRPSRVLRSIAWLGDSITNGESSDGSIAYAGAGRFTHCLLRQNVLPAKNTDRGDWDFGYSGYDIRHLHYETKAGYPYSKLPADQVIASGADAVVVHAGTNDVTNGRTAAQIVSDMTGLWDYFRANRVEVIGTELPPRSSGNATVDAANAVLAGEASARRMLFAPWNAIGKSGGVAVVGYYPDGIHPNAIAQREKAGVLASLISERYSLHGFSFPPSGSSEWVTPNPYMIGTQGGGSVGLSPSWVVAPGTGCTVVHTKVAASDGIGEWQQLAITDPAPYHQTTLQVAVSTALTAGDVCVGVAEIEAGDDLVAKEVSLRMANVTTVSGAIQWDLYLGGSGGVASLAGPVAKYSGVLRTPQVTVEATGTSTRFLTVYIWGTGTIRVRRAGIVKLQ